VHLLLNRGEVFARRSAFGFLHFGFEMIDEYAEVVACEHL
jgi:hypothetical protein